MSGKGSLIPEIVTSAIREEFARAIQQAAARMHADMDELGVHDNDPCRRTIDHYRRKLLAVLNQDNMFRDSVET